MDEARRTLAGWIDAQGAVSVGRFMALANRHYYAYRDPLGARGDFVTAPEISQMFGELIGLWMVDLWGRAGRPDCAFVELGPGRGTLAQDALRVATRLGLAPPVHLVETSPELREAQRQRLPDAHWHDQVETLPGDRSLIVIANEFFDALPIEQAIRGRDDWHRRMVTRHGDIFVPVAGERVPDGLMPARFADAPPGSIVESSPAMVAIIGALADRLARQGGAMLVIDYGYDGPALGETLQAVHEHRFVNPFETPGSVDLSAHVDFVTMAAAMARGGARVHGPVSQRDFLGALGLSERATRLAVAHPEQAEVIAMAHGRLMGEDGMGRLFRAMAMTAPQWPVPDGFEQGCGGGGPSIGDAE